MNAVVFDSAEPKKCINRTFTGESSFDTNSKNDSTNWLSNYSENEAKTLTIEELEYQIYNKGKRPPSKYKEWLNFVKEKQCPRSLDFYQQINEDISPFYILENGETVSKITKEMLKKGYATEYVLPLRIKNHICQPTNVNLYGLDNHINEIGHLLPENIDFMYTNLDEDFVLPADDGNENEPYNDLKDALRRNECLRKRYNNNQTEIRPGSIAFNHGSFIAQVGVIPKPRLFPLLSFCKRDCFKDILFPVPSSLPTFNDFVNWEAKESRIVWRGTTTGTLTSPNKLFELSHRYRLVNWAKMYKKYVFQSLSIDVDIGFSDFLQCDNGHCEEAKKNSLHLGFLTIDQQFRSKYLIVVDGNTWSFRLPAFLASNSVVFYNSVYKFWFGKLIKPYVHYMPFKEDFSDLIEQLEYAKNHDEEMKQISQNARKFIEEFVTRNSLSCYLGLLLMEYADLMKHLD